ncbi:hypothetical protein [Legionella brunensis]|uniref:Uncharacterized protein n=1 Tax=Legionella brunensis TaxID=29422 RepID=A0A0W0ST54_9GAMM|nr:hypothetical protein [Legionella brunensis]KTC86536.1 hypothetical protein Lbru_0477 [Legionella brunensis]HAT3877925.1 hypothetical protein [Legionella pneumophila]
MKFFLLFFLISTTVFANPINQKLTVHCPKSVECNDNPYDGYYRCHASNDEYNMWGVPEYGSIYYPSGNYKLEKVKAELFPNGDITCFYRINNKQPLDMTIKLRRQLDHFQTFDEGTLITNTFSPIQNDLSHWVVNGGNAICESNNTFNCPMTEVPEVVISRRASGSLSFFWPSNDQSGFEAPFVTSGRLDFNSLKELCGITSTCILNVGHCSPDKDYCEVQGIVSIDLSNADGIQINEINAVPSSPVYCNFKRREPFNTLDCEPIEDTSYK